MTWSRRSIAEWSGVPRLTDAVTTSFSSRSPSREHWCDRPSRVQFAERILAELLKIGVESVQRSGEGLGIAAKRDAHALVIRLVGEGGPSRVEL
jgi:hypothetical protein